MSMTIPEAHAAIRGLYEKGTAIENRYPDGLTQEDNAEDYAESKRILTEIDGLEDKLSGLEEASARKTRILENGKRLATASNRHVQPDPDETGEVRGAGGQRMVKMFGEQFIESEEYQRIIGSGVLHNPQSRIEMAVQLKGSLLDVITHKALVYSGSGAGGPMIVRERLPGFTDILQRPITVLDMLPTTSTTSNLIEYIQELTFANNAAAVAEATVSSGTTGTKPESGMTFITKNSAVQTVAHWMPVTNQMLADAPAIEGVIRARLITGLNLVLETLIISGDGSAPNLLGILNAGIQSRAPGGDSTIDAAYKAMNQVMVTGLANPDGFVVHPNDWMTVRLSRENISSGLLGQYLYGPPNVAGPSTLWGRPVALSLGIAEKTLLTADWQMLCMLFDREQSAIRVGLINDFFTRNMQVILAELRAAMVVFRPTAACKVTGLV